MPSQLLNALRRHPALSRIRQRRSRKQVGPRPAPSAEPKPRPARVPQTLTMTTRRINRDSEPTAVVPYLRMSGRWLEECGFAIGAGVQVIAERGRIVLTSADVEIEP